MTMDKSKTRAALEPSSAWQLYQKALQERKSDDPEDRRQACEDGWIAVTLAVDEFLATKGFIVEQDTAYTHVDRLTILGDLAMEDENARAIFDVVPEISEILDGLCFFARMDTPFADKLLETTVRGLLERTGQIPSE